MHCGFYTIPAWRTCQPLGLCEKDLKLTMAHSEGVHRLVLGNALHILYTLSYPVSEIVKESSCSL